MPEKDIIQPQAYTIGEAVVKFCPICGVRFVKAVVTNYTFTCPACSQLFHILRDPEE